MSLQRIVRVSLGHPTSAVCVAGVETLVGIYGEEWEGDSADPEAGGSHRGVMKEEVYPCWLAPLPPPVLCAHGCLMPWLPRTHGADVSLILFDVKLQPACAESWALGGRRTFNSLNYLDFVKSVCVTAIFQGQEDVELRRGSDFLNCVLHKDLYCQFPGSEMSDFVFPERKGMLRSVRLMLAEE
eukprot:bmy_08210T0